MRANSILQEPGLVEKDTDLLLGSFEKDIQDALLFVGGPDCCCRSATVPFAVASLFGDDEKDYLRFHCGLLDVAEW